MVPAILIALSPITEPLGPGNHDPQYHCLGCGPISRFIELRLYGSYLLFQISCVRALDNQPNRVAMNTAGRAPIDTVRAGGPLVRPGVGTSEEDREVSRIRRQRGRALGKWRCPLIDLSSMTLRRFSFSHLMHPNLTMIRKEITGVHGKDMGSPLFRIPIFLEFAHLRVPAQKVPRRSRGGRFAGRPTTIASQLTTDRH